jgi:sec-independent protein translocase protein TatA
MTSLLAFGPGPTTLVIILLFGVLLFGKKLPEIGRMLGKGLVEFKKGLAGLEDTFDTTTAARPSEPAALEQPRPPQRVTTTAPKFEDSPNNITTTPKA